MKHGWSAVVLVSMLLVGSASALALPFTNIYVIGDSLSDQGNLKTVTTVLAGPDQSLPDSAHYFNGRFSNGPVYTDFLSQALGVPLSPTQSGGTNFAYGGARTDYNVVEARVGGPLPNDLYPWSLNAQVDAFRAAGISDPGALFIVLSGANDVGDILRRGLDPNVAVPNVVDAIIDAVDAFKMAGAQKVVVGNVADLGLTPAFLSLGPTVAGIATGLSASLNSLLDARLAMISGVDIVELDVFDFVRELVADPAEAGLLNVTQPCYTGFVAPIPAGTECSNPDEYLFWDAVHPTSTVHKLLAEQLLAQIPEPSSLLLIAPLLAALLIRRRLPQSRFGAR